MDLSRRLRRWGFWPDLPALHFTVSSLVFAYVFKASFWVGSYRGIPLVDHVLSVPWWPLLVVRPLLPENLLTRPWGLYVVIAGSFVWVYVTGLVVVLAQRYRKRREAAREPA